ncbi:FAD/NAD(P)-binding domain-containing protein [Aaosphaeria arxii CBS 175.79]|uniref:FAD/NAD(P)-binding domain-containing protein n=1 Tax=Aaosphaeria arxii CBS 175.79 TaxID=1450172 RepID=A0A6A5XQG6_9PLEO|nr:FAD/NAD(P)-binding domain-containing protein [Aaosphaeria arxii CBS 175.79]KAF2015077.1 FAD/NAD(P)-binding domain-containing protein [Aaosphaeria arxii CBS 175.79]
MLSPNALRALDSLGAYERLRGKALQFDKLYFKDDKDKTTDIYYFGSKVIYGYQAMRIMRKELLDELLVMLRERSIPVHFDSALATVDYDGPDPNSKVGFTFTNGQKDSASLLIGADGIHSMVRSTFLPEVKPKYAGILGISCVVQRSQLRIPDEYGLPAIAVGKPGGFLLVPQKPDGSELYVGAQRRFPETDDWNCLRKDQQKLYDMIHENQTDWPDIVQSALEAMSLDRMGCWAFYSLPPLSSWLSESKRIILVGDAAHAIPPTVGQGANQAIEDVCALASLLSKLSPQVSLDKAAALWQSYRQKRVQKILDLTQQMNAKRLPEAEKAKLPPNAIWTDTSLTRGEGGELRWLYDPDMFDEAEKWAQGLKLKGTTTQG